MANMILDDPNAGPTVPDSLTDLEIFTKIWTSPRMVFRYLIDKNYQKYFELLLILSGISRAFDRASSKSLGDYQDLDNIVLYSILVGGGLGWIFYYLYALGIEWTGKWLNGTARAKTLLRTMTYASIPSILGLLLLILEIAFFDIGIFQSQYDVISYDLSIIILFLA